MRPLRSLAGALVFGMALAAGGATAQPACPQQLGIGAGDTVASIARRCGINPETLRRFNPGLRDDTLRPGGFVTIPRPAVPSTQERHGRDGVGTAPPLVTSPRVGAPPTVIMPPKQPQPPQPVMPWLNNPPNPFPAMPGKP